MYLHYDPYTKRNSGILPRQRMDFLLLLPNRKLVVLELDGVRHYAGTEGRAKARLNCRGTHRGSTQWIREGANENRYEVSAWGRIPSRISEAYQRATS